MKFKFIGILMLISVLFVSGCSAPAEPAPQTPETTETDTTPTPQPQSSPQPKTNLVPSESGTKIYLGMLQAGLDEVVVDVKSSEVLIAFNDDPTLNNDALIYYAFGLSLEFEPNKQTTTILIFSGNTISREASADNADIKALKDGQLSDEEFKEKVRWVK